MVTNNFVLIAILFSIILFVLAIGNDFCENCKDSKGRRLFLLFEYAYFVILVGYIVEYFVVRNSIFDYFVTLIIWYGTCTIYASLIAQIAYVCEYYERWVSVSIGFICYFSLGSSLVEVVFSKFSILHNKTGYAFVCGVFNDLVFFGTPLVVFVLTVISILVNYSKSHTKVRERYLLKIMTFSVVPSVVGIVTEYFLLKVYEIYYPIFSIVLILTFYFFKDLHIQNRKFRFIEEDFAEYLDSSKTDIVLICDDNQCVVFQNKSAQVISDMQRDNFIGRKLADIFMLDSDIEREIGNREKIDGLMVPALYPPVDRHVILDVSHLYDCCNEILNTIVVISNYEVSMGEENFDFYVDSDNANARAYDDIEVPFEAEKEAPFDYEQDKKVIADGSRVLLVSENVNNLSDFEKLLVPYDLEITKAIGGRSALDILKQPAFDIVFVAYDMDKLSGLETVKRIREMDGDYYKDVPVIFILSCAVENIYKDLLSVTFNDFIQKPILAKKLNAVLTRWLWRRYAISEKYDYTSGNTRMQHYKESLESMYDDCVLFYGEKKWFYLGCCLKGLKRTCGLLEDSMLINACDELVDTYLLEDYEALPEIFEKFYMEKTRFVTSQSETSLPL